jgi:hypothetical protein
VVAFREVPPEASVPRALPGAGASLPMPLSVKQFVPLVYSYATAAEVPARPSLASER